MSGFLLNPFANYIQSLGLTDSIFSSVPLLLSGDGATGTQNNTFVDSSTNNFTITRNGNTTQGSFSPYGSNWSNYFDGSGDYLDVGSTSYNMAGNWTIEFWFNASNTGSILFDCRPDSTNGYYPELSISSSTQLDFYFNSSSHFFTVPQFLNTWNHVAIVKNSTTITIYFNGSSVYTVSDANTWGVGTSRPRIGANGGFYSGAPAVLAGYISNLRIVNGTAVYTANFTPSTAPLTAITNTSLLTCQANRFRDASTNNYSITPTGNVSVQRFSPFAPAEEYSTTTNGGSGYFDGNGDYLTTPNSANLTIGTSDFTIELWAYFSDASSQSTLYDQRPSTVSVYPLLYKISSTVNFYVSGGNRITSSTIYAGTWIHIVVSRVSGTTRLFINGAQSGNSYTDSNNYLANLARTGVEIPSLNAYLSGYISDLRVVIGTGVTSVTVPTTPLTAITNTQLLLGFKNAGIIDNSMINDVETIGNAQISTTVKKYGTASLYFDGTGDALKISTKQPLALSGDFTIESWIYLAATNVFYPVIFYTGTNPYAGIRFGDGGFSYLLQFGINLNILAGVYSCNYSQTQLANQWVHVAWTRAAGVNKLFVNGVQQLLRNTTSGPFTLSSFTDSSNFGGTLPWTIGNSSANDNNWNGYIDDLRVTNGIARYTADFTPPTAALPAK